MTFNILVPELGESVLEATIFQWLKEEGDRVDIGDVLVELETNKVNIEVGAERSGILEEIHHQAGQDVNVGEVLGVIKQDSEEPDQDREAPESNDKESENGTQSFDKETKKQIAREKTKTQEGKPAASPLAKRIAQDQRVDLEAVRGSGKDGLITKEDVQRHIEDMTAEETATPKNKEVRSQNGTGAIREERIKMSRRRRTIAENLVAAQRNAAILTTFNEIDMSAVLDLRKRRNPNFQEQHGIKLGITSFFIKAAIAALKKYPRLNAEIDGDEIILKHYYDIGVAIGDEDGLVVPVIREADRLSFAEIEQKIDYFVKAVQEKSLSITDLRGGTFSITNGGVFGSLLSTPILNPPQVSILGLHKIEPRPVAVNDEIEIRAMMYVALGYDHRIVDGREAVQFLMQIKNLVEDPERLLLAG